MTSRQRRPLSGERGLAHLSDLKNARCVSPTPPFRERFLAISAGCRRGIPAVTEAAGGRGVTADNSLSAGRGGRCTARRPRIHEQRNPKVSSGEIRYVKQTENFDLCNSCKRLGNELHESKILFVSRIEFIRSKLSIFSPHVSVVGECPGQRFSGSDAAGAGCDVPVGTRRSRYHDDPQSRLPGSTVGFSPISSARMKV